MSFLSVRDPGRGLLSVQSVQCSAVLGADRLGARGRLVAASSPLWTKRGSRSSVSARRIREGASWKIGWPTTRGTGQGGRFCRVRDVDPTIRCYRPRRPRSHPRHDFTGVKQQFEKEKLDCTRYALRPSDASSACHAKQTWVSPDDGHGRALAAVVPSA